MKVSRFNYKDRARKGRKTWAVKALITEEEKMNLEQGARKLTDGFINNIVGRIDVYAPEKEEDRAVFGDTCYWFWIYEDEMSDIAFSLLYCLTAVASGTTPEAVKMDYLTRAEE